MTGNKLSAMTPKKLSRILRTSGVANTLAIGVSILTLIALLTALRGQLWDSEVSRSLWAVITDKDRRPETVALPLLYDPAGILVLLTCAFAPVCFAMQIYSVAEFNHMCELNTDYRANGRRDSEINQLTRQANKWFERFGSRLTAIGFSIASLVISALVFRLNSKRGNFRIVESIQIVQWPMG